MSYVVEITEIAYARFLRTAKLGDNKLGCSKQSVITNKLFSPKSAFTVKFTNYLGYNEPQLYAKTLTGPELFVVTEFDCL